MISLLEKGFKTKDGNGRMAEDNGTPDLKLAVSTLNKATDRLFRILAVPA